MSHLPHPKAMTNREAGYALLSDPRATPLERHNALVLIAGAETPKAQDEAVIAAWREARRAAPVADHRRAA